MWTTLPDAHEKGPRGIVARGQAVAEPKRHSVNPGSWSPSEVCTPRTTSAAVAADSRG